MPKNTCETYRILVLPKIPKYGQIEPQFERRLDGELTDGCFRYGLLRGMYEKVTSPYEEGPTIGFALSESRDGALLVTDIPYMSEEHDALITYVVNVLLEEAHVCISHKYDEFIRNPFYCHATAPDADWVQHKTKLRSVRETVQAGIRYKQLPYVDHMVAIRLGDESFVDASEAHSDEVTVPIEVAREIISEYYDTPYYQHCGMTTYPDIKAETVQGRELSDRQIIQYVSMSPDRVPGISYKQYITLVRNVLEKSEKESVLGNSIGVIAAVKQIREQQSTTNLLEAM